MDVPQLLNPTGEVNASNVAAPAFLGSNDFGMVKQPASTSVTSIQQTSPIAQISVPMLVHENNNNNNNNSSSSSSIDNKVDSNSNHKYPTALSPSQIKKTTMQGRISYSYPSAGPPASQVVIQQAPFAVSEFPATSSKYATPTAQLDDQSNTPGMITFVENKPVLLPLSALSIECQKLSNDLAHVQPTNLENTTGYNSLHSLAFAAYLESPPLPDNSDTKVNKKPEQTAGNMAGEEIDGRENVTAAEEREATAVADILVASRKSSVAVQTADQVGCANQSNGSPFGPSDVYQILNTPPELSVSRQQSPLNMQNSDARDEDNTESTLLEGCRHIDPVADDPHPSSQTPNCDILDLKLKKIDGDLEKPVCDEEMKCSFEENCDTGSPLRKVVSHIFGRNKLATRQIPSNLWVYYCRKHYQRSRYRNPSGFALLQCDLVRQQVNRLHEWGGVKDWVVKVRKREELKLKRAAGEIPSLAAAANDDDAKLFTVECSNYDTSPLEMDKNPNTTWLSDLKGTERSVKDVHSLIDRIENELASTKGSFPDIEILPNVCGDLVDVPAQLPAPSTRSSTGTSIKTKLNTTSTLERTRSKRRKKSKDSIILDDSNRTTDLLASDGVARSKKTTSLPRSVKPPNATSVRDTKMLASKCPVTATMHKRKAASTLSPAFDTSSGTGEFILGSPTNILDSSFTAYERASPSGLSNKRSKGLDTSPTYVEAGNMLPPHIQPLGITTAENDNPHEPPHAVTLPPPTAEDGTQRQRRRLSTTNSNDSYYVAGYTTPTYTTSSSDRVTTYSYSVNNYQTHFQRPEPTPPASNSSFSGTSEGEETDTEKKVRLSIDGVIPQSPFSTGYDMGAWYGKSTPRRYATMSSTNPAMPPPPASQNVRASNFMQRRRNDTEEHMGTVVMTTPRSAISTLNGAAYAVAQNRNRDRRSPPSPISDRARSRSISPGEVYIHASSIHSKRSRHSPVGRDKLDGTAGIRMKRSQTEPSQMRERTTLVGRDSPSR